MMKTTVKLFKAVFKACQDLKAEDMVSLDLTRAQSYTDVVLIVTARSDRQMQALADRVLEQALHQCCKHPLGVEGYGSSVWILIDFGDLICHIFSDAGRETYHLEDMWPQVKPLSEKETEKFFTQKVRSRPGKVKKTVVRKAGKSL